MIFYIYKTTNLINNKIYIGQHVTNNLNDNYLGSGKLLKKAIKKYGKENFKKEILCFCDSTKELNRIEESIITEGFIKRKDVYNLRLGGGSQGLLTKDIKQKISKNHEDFSNRI
jgi:hypothetical protein